MTFVPHAKIGRTFDGLLFTKKAIVCAPRFGKRTILLHGGEGIVGTGLKRSSGIGAIPSSLANSSAPRHRWVPRARRPRAPHGKKLISMTTAPAAAAHHEIRASRSISIVGFIRCSADWKLVSETSPRRQRQLHSEREERGREAAVHPRQDGRPGQDMGSRLGRENAVKREYTEGHAHEQRR